MRLIKFSPPILVVGLALLGADLFHFLKYGAWHGMTSADALNYLGWTFQADGFWLNVSPGWPLLVLGLIIGEAGLIQNRILAAKEQKMMERLRIECEERRAHERHADMLVKRERRKRHILERAA
jgi:hypothetical protein